jgi:hypothetical protein
MANLIVILDPTGKTMMPSLDKMPPGTRYAQIHIEDLPIDKIEQKKLAEEVAGIMFAGLTA